MYVFCAQEKERKKERKKERGERKEREERRRVCAGTYVRFAMHYCSGVFVDVIIQGDRRVLRG